jgi:hypothetical protein
MKTFKQLLIVVLLVVCPAYSQRAPAPPIDYATAHLDRIATAVRINEEIKLDGLLEEPAWRLAIPAANFVRWRPSPGEPAGEPTEVYFLYDDDNLYVGFICHDSDPSKIRVNDLREDFSFTGNDGVALVIDSLNDDRSGFLFGANPAGAKRDAQVSNDSAYNWDWDGVWDVRVSRNSEGWLAELRIPFKTLRFSGSSTQEWGLNINRHILRFSEESQWSPLPVRYTFSRISLAGTLRGLENIRQGRNLKVTPYITSSFSQTRNRGLQWNDHYDGGVDLKYGLTPSLTLDGTVNTDFAQVEADQQQVNLTRFSLFFPEKRGFFLENAGTFTFGNATPGGPLVPFFSRRIGLNPRLAPVPILGGARVSGQVGRYDVGFLTMKSKELNPLKDPDVDPLDATPSNNYVVGRIKRNLRTNSWIGALATHRDSSNQGDYNRVYGADARFQFLGRLNLDSYLLKSKTPGLTGQDQARRAGMSWDDDEVNVSAGYLTIQPNFKPELGFVRRENMTQYDGSLGWKPLIRSSRVIRSLQFETELTYIAGAGSGVIETRDHQITGGVQFWNGGYIRATTTKRFERLNRRFAIRPDIAITGGDYAFREQSISTQSNPSRKISGIGSVEWGSFWNGNRKTFSGDLTLKPSYRWNLALNYAQNRVTLPQGKFTTNLMGAKLIYGFSPFAFFNAFIQYNADTKRVSSNIRFNWTYKPLSDLYIVYNDTRDTSRGEPVDRAIIIKVTNLFNF